MSRGSESATWKWADDKRHCDTCGRKLRIKDVALFYSASGTDERFIRCFDCVAERREAFITRTRRQMGIGS